MGQVSQHGLSQAFQRAKASIIAANLAGILNPTTAQIQAAQNEADNAVLSQSYLRLEQPLVASQNLVKFPLLINAAGAAPVRTTEVRLNQQDAFFCSSIGIYIAVATSATVTNFALQTYPNPVTFATGGALPAPLNTFYNGFLKITINKSVIVPNYPMTNFYQIPQTQLTAATNSPNTEIDFSIVSLWEPTINFIGTKQSDLTIEMPTNLTAVDANTYAVIILQGVLAQNVTLMS